jgi:hypothetical protein
MNLPLACALAIALGVTVQTTHAQLKFKDSPSPNVNTTTPSPASPADPVRDAKEKAAAEVAQRWLALLDKGEYGKAWDECGPLFQSRVTRTQWVEGLPKDRGPFGAFKSRKLEGLGYPKAQQGMPPIEYVQISFSSVFEKQDKILEVVNLVLDGGTWRPVGYLIQ